MSSVNVENTKFWKETYSGQILVGFKYIPKELSDEVFYGTCNEAIARLKYHNLGNKVLNFINCIHKHFPNRNIDLTQLKL